MLHFLRNVKNLLLVRKTPKETTWKTNHLLNDFHPISAKDQSRSCTRKEFGRGDTRNADIEELETMDASEIYSQRLDAKEVIFPKETGEFIFPNQTPWKKIKNWESHLDREHTIRVEGHVDFLGKSEGSLPPPQDSLPDAGEAANDSWSMSGNFIYRHQVEPRVKTLFAERRTIPDSTEIHWRIQNYKNGCETRAPDRRLLKHWWVKRFVCFLDKIHSVYSIRRETSRRIKMWSGKRLTRRQLTSRPDHLWPELWMKLGRNAKLKEKQKWSQWKTETR